MTTSNKLTYKLVEGWEQLPAGYHHADVVGVSTDSKGLVYLLTRDEPRVLVYNGDGTLATSFGEGLFTNRTHGLTVGPDDTVYCADDGDHTVRKFSADGKLLLTIGTAGVASDSGYTGTTASIVRGAPPFNRPTNVAVAPSGDLYVCDGYGNARVHRFSADGKLIQSWGEPGGAPGLFNLPHGIRVAADGRVLVADRENDRIQFFSPTGEYICEWTQVQRPTDIFIDPAGLIYVSELTWRVGQHSFRRGDAAAMEPGRVTVFDPDGNVLARIGGNADVTAPGNFVAPHCICVDAAGDIYVGEVTNTFGIKTGFVPEGSHMFQKFTRA